MRVHPWPIALILLACACAHPQKAPETVPSGITAPPAAPPPARKAMARPGATAAIQVRSCNADQDCGPRQLCLHAQCVDITPELAECSSIRVHFDFNDSQLHPDERARMQRMARCLKADQSMKLVVSGTTDERGSAAHNSELAEKRAMAVAHTLQQQGVSAQQLSVVSYGENFALCGESDRDCWAKNRRGDMLYSGEF